jgi:hypothetical protein
VPRALSLTPARPDFECSAQTGRDVEKPFNFIASQFHNNYETTVRRANALYMS